MFCEFAEHLAAHGQHVLLFDWPGHGRSGPLRDPHTGEMFCVVLQELLVKAKGIDATTDVDAFSLIGHSMGGAIATLFGARHPVAVRKLVLVAPAGFVDIGWMGRALQYRWFGEFAFSIFGAKNIRDSVPKDHAKPFSPESLDRMEKDLALVDWQIGIQGSELYLSLLSCLRHFPFGDVSSPLAVIAGDALHDRTCIMWGDADEVCLFDVGFAGFTKALPRAKTCVLVGCGHAAFQQQVQEGRKAIVDWLTEKDSQS